jgi:cysteine desulfurase
MSTKRPIYLDYMATTPVDPRVKVAMMDCLDSDGVFGNPASNSHVYGWEAEERVKAARLQVARLIHATPREIVFTSGATESNNLAIKGAATFYEKNGRHIITMSTEHKAVLDTCEALADEGFSITYIDPQPNGLLNLDDFKKALQKDTILVSIMQVNNEIGVLQDLHAIATLAKSEGVVVHTDAAQAAGKIPIDVRTLPVDLMSFSSHKVYGPKGMGALYVRRSPRVHVKAQIHGGGHEFGLRSGTLATHQIVGMGEAFAIAKADFEVDSARISFLTERLWCGIAKISGVRLNGDAAMRVPGNLNVCFEGVDGEALMLGVRDLALSTGSACNSASLQVSYVLKALGLTNLEASSSLRICVGRFTTELEVDQAIASITAQVLHLRSIAPRG